MAKTSDFTPLDAVRPDNAAAAGHRQVAIGASDIVVFLAMAIAAVAVGVALHLQAGIASISSGLMAAGVFALFALVHVQKLRIDRLRAAPISAVAEEPGVPVAASNDAALDLASSKLEAAAAALREGDPAVRPRPVSARTSRRRPRAGDAQGEKAEPSLQMPEHGWGEPETVDALVRQYAEELDRGGPVAPAEEIAPTPALAAPAARYAAATAADPAATGAGQSLADAIRRGAEGQVEIHLQPIVAFADRKARYYEVFPRLLDGQGAVLSLADYGAEASRLGLALAIERAAILRCCAIQRSLAERGRAKTMIIRLSSAAIRDRAFLQRLLADTRPDPLLTDLLVFEVDQIEIEQGDGVERDNMELLGKAGFRFSLGSADTLALEVQELTARRIGYVRVTPSVLDAEQNPAAVSELRAGGVETILTSISREEDAKIARAFGLVLGQGSLYSDPKPIRSDVAAASGATAKKAGGNRAA